MKRGNESNLTKRRSNFRSYEEYRPAILAHLTGESAAGSVDTGIAHYDAEIRSLSAKAIGKIAEDKAGAVVSALVRQHVRSSEAALVLVMCAYSLNRPAARQAGGREKGRAQARGRSSCSGFPGRGHRCALQS